jgi:hypothetical protein
MLEAGEEASRLGPSRGSSACGASRVNGGYGDGSEPSDLHSSEEPPWTESNRCMHLLALLPVCPAMRSAVPEDVPQHSTEHSQGDDQPDAPGELLGKPAIACSAGHERQTD